MTTEKASRYIKLRPRQPESPTNVSPTAGSIVSVTPTLTSSAFDSNEVAGEVHIYSRWRVGNDAAMTSIIYDSGITTDLLSHIVPELAGLVGITTYYWDCSHVGARGGESDPSIATDFETVANISTLFRLNNFTGNGGTQNYVTGLDMTVNSFNFIHNLVDPSFYEFLSSSVGISEYREIFSNGQPFQTDVNSVTAFNNDGISVGSHAAFNGSGDLISLLSGVVSKGFCDIIEYTGDDTAVRALPHILEMDVGFIMVMLADDPGSGVRLLRWYEGMLSDEIIRESGAITTGSTSWGNTLPTDTDIYIGKNIGVDDINLIGRKFVMLVFPKDSPVGVQVGTYVGDGIAGNKIITGFPTGYVFTNSPTTAANTVTDVVSGVANGRTISDNAPNPVHIKSYLQSFDSDGFTLSSESDVNSIGVTYNYLAIKDPTI